MRQRFRCRGCRKSFSESTFSPAYRQKKIHLNHQVYIGLVSAGSQRRLAKNLRTNRKTIARKLEFLGKQSLKLMNEDLANFPISTDVQFDDLETFEHSKMKPLSVVAMVEKGSRRVLGFRVAQMPAKGKLAAKSRKKYGHRKDHRKEMREALFEEIAPHIDRNAEIWSDRNPSYPQTVRRFFPNAVHKTCKGRRGCVVGQGELKRGGKDPLFSLNHTFAMFRANINRLFRRTWNTTKRPDRLKYHIALYCLFHNWSLIPQTGRLRPVAEI